MARTHRRIKTGVLRARAADNTFTGTSFNIALIEPQKPWRWTGEPKGRRFKFSFGTLHGPNGFPGNVGGVFW
ncbi:hypothetical protein SEA_HORTUS1_109 [Microbacterium phage Hortus1]|nr:hypothetical protein SEA_HORTUS1_109 [Microbacterium phage Hortus1]AWY06438.1 hypothetical protein SEA_TANDEM_109 [Microbacterium phage Tandem]QAU07438.1 hypothetical protein SEA_ALLEB_106 [Microbacterium phage Alleb]